MTGLIPKPATGLPVLAGAGAGVVSLVIGGRVWEHFADVEVRMSMRETAGEFTLHVFEPLGSSGAEAAEAMLDGIDPLDECQIFYAGQLVLEGHVDAVAPAYSRTHRRITLQGRSGTGDLVDSSADGEVEGGELRDVTIQQLASRLTERFKVAVRVDAAVSDTIDVVRIRPGETVHEVLERYARMLGLAVHPDRDGGLVLRRIEGGGSPAATLTEGHNILEASAMLRGDRRHSSVRVVGQDTGTDDEAGEAVAERKAEVQDKAVKRHRPLSLLSEGRTARRGARQRAAWEAAVRAGESTRVEAKVVGWEHAPGELWELGQRVRVVSPLLKGLDRTLVIESMVLTQGRKRGTQAALSLVPTEALTPTAPSRNEAKPKPSAGQLTGSDLDDYWSQTRPDEDPI